MNKPALLLCLFASTLTAASVALAAPEPRAPRLALADCLDPNQARGWTNVEGDRHLLVDGGRHGYRLELSGACSAIRYSHIIGFRGDPVSGRICGSIGDAILTEDYPCQIRSIELLTREEYRQALKDHETWRKVRKQARKAGKADRT